MPVLKLQQSTQSWIQLPRLSNDLSPLRRLQYLPLAPQVLILIVLPQLGDDPVGDVLEVMGCEGEDRGAGAGEADAEEAGFGLGGHELDDLGEPGDEGLAVGLVDFVLHREVDELGVGRRLAERDGEQGNSLQVECL